MWRLGADQWSTRRRAAQFGWLTVGLASAAVGMFVVALVVAPQRDAGFHADTVLLPLNVEFAYPGGAALASAALLVASTFFGLAALQTAAVMRVLAPDRHIPPPPPSSVRRARRVLLGPLDSAVRLAEDPPALPPSALLGPEALPAGTVLRSTVLIPAHNEEAVLGLTLQSLAEQSRPPDRVVVVADNCTDATVEVARAHGAEVFETVGNSEKKAGALNQELDRLLPSAEPRDVVMVMDADSTIAPEFMEVALGLLESDRDLIAVGGLFYGEDGARLVGQFQRNEYTRYQRTVARKLGRVFVLTGTASVVRAYAMRAVRRFPWPVPARPRRTGLRHARADRGQRTHLGLEDAGCPDDLAAGVPGDDRGHDGLA